MISMIASKSLAGWGEHGPGDSGEMLLVPMTNLAPWVFPINCTEKSSG